MSSSSLWENFLNGNGQDSSEYEELQQQLIEIWKNNRTNGGEDIYTQLEGRLYRIGNDASQSHFCTEYCSSHPPWARQENLVGSVLDVFVNHKTGHYHICTGKHCGAKHVFSAEGGLSTCTISGLQFSEQVYINSFKLNHEYHRTSSSIVRVETALLRDTSKQLIKTFLFSDIRRRAEEKKLFEARKEVHKMLLKEKRECDRAGKRLNVMELITQAYHIRKKKINKEYNFPPEATQEIIYNFYSNKICQIVMKLKTLTSFSIDAINTHFVCALLYLMRKGLIINDVAVIAADFYLKSSLPECNSLDQYGVSKTHFTNSKTIVCGAFRDAILNGVNPHHLLVSSLQSLA